MRPALLAIATAAVFAAGAATAADTPRLTVYSGDFDAVARSMPMPGGAGFALYDATLEFQLRAGEDMVSLGGLPAALDAGSVRLRPRGDARVRGQRYDFAVAGQSELLERAIGSTITVEQDVGGQRRTVSGVLLAAGDGLTLRLPDGRIKVLSQYTAFDLDALPAGVVAEPTLTWSIASARGGRQAFDFAYATSGLGWRAEYVAELSGQGRGCRMDFEGAAMVANRSGTAFEGVQLTLVAGEPNRQQKGYAGTPRMARAEMMVADAAVAPEASGEYHAYRLPGTGDLPQDSVQRLPLIAPASGVACERRYETRAPQGGWVPPQPMLDPDFTNVAGKQPVTAMLGFANREADGLGLPLPAGRVRVFTGGDLLGEASLAHTALGQKVELALGTVFDLDAERSRLDFQVDRAGRTMTERVRVTLRNAKAEAATVHVVETLPRWSDWEIVASTVAAKKLDATSAGFDVAVPAGGETHLEYTVRYRWAPDVRID
ncbi:DUF4139 domain-containing protein [Arenimonas composti]|uniref:DUF4139 domain-containing protein n=1 Tax=Arenimonas composti TR7-09 = DSM 18010 TaxID=1121013 RepID=A0A091BHU8_9GAMM|nr:DUF4139 domain-containing protein [Arenimonas composti]KFN50349.1 hypothetical protein P873_06655 [Arenimonas composti TR7-09 = DSM 18010]